MTDWTTCRVVRDRDGDLWFRGCDSDDLWTANTNYPDIFLTTDEVLTVFGPLAPVLDADGLPVVHTVGDLTARHLRRDISVEGMRTTATLLAMRIPPRNQPLPLVAFLVRIDGTIGTTDYYPLDAPCEVQSSQPLPPDRREPSMNRDTETVPARHETPDMAKLRRLAEGATQGPWFWWGNTDNHSIALCGRQPGLGVCEVISTLSVDRSTTGWEADRLRRDLAEYTDLSLSDIEDAVEEWATDEYDQPRTDQRLSVTDENHIRRTAEELAVYEVARAQGLPDDTPRDHERVYRADVCDLRATNARYLAAANPAAVLGLLNELDTLADRLAHMTEARDNARAKVKRLTLLLAAAEPLAEWVMPDEEDEEPQQ